MDELERTRQRGCRTATSDAPELKLQIKGHIEPPDKDEVDETEDDDGRRVTLDDIADHAFATLRGSNNLLFSGSRRTVEAMADRLRRRSEIANVPNEFFPHHGSITKELREELKGRLKEGALPTTAVATTTLELGIYLGSVKSVAQVGAPRSLAGWDAVVDARARQRSSGSHAQVPYLAPDSDRLDHSTTIVRSGDGHSPAGGEVRGDARSPIRRLPRLCSIRSSH